MAHDLYDPDHLEAPYLIDGRPMTYEAAVRRLTPALGERGAKEYLHSLWNAWRRAIFR